MANPDPSIVGKRCLVLDDEFLIALDIQQILETAGAVSVVSVSSAAEALKVLGKEGQFDLAVLDIKLSDAAASSLGVADELTAQRTPFIFLTGMRADEIPAGPFRDAPVVEKPYQAAVLLEALKRALGGR